MNQGHAAGRTNPVIASGRRAQAIAAERAHGPAAPTEAPPTYAGLVTRALAFAIDAAIVDLTGIFVGVVVGLALSVLKTPDKVDHVLLAKPLQKGEPARIDGIETTRKLMEIDPNWTDRTSKP